MRNYDRIVTQRINFADACRAIACAILVDAILRIVVTPVVATQSTDELVEVRGTVVDFQGLAIKRAELRSNPSLAVAPLATTDELGRFSFRLPKSQKLHLLTIGPGCSPALQKPVPDSDLELKIQLQPSHGMRLKLVDAKGTPIAGAKVSGDDWRDFAIIHHMTTNEEGRVAWSEAPNDSMEYLITKEGFSPRYNIRLKADPAEQIVVLSRVVELLVQAQDEDTNELIHDFVAVPVLKSRADADRLCNRSSAIHTLNGKASLKLHESESLTGVVRVEAEGYAVSNCPMFDIGNAPSSVVVKLHRVDSLRGHIIDLNGNPASGAMVSFANPIQPFTLRQPGQNYSDAANEKGEFAFPHEEGNYTIIAQNELGFAIEHRKSGNQPGTIQLQSWAMIDGKIGQGTSEIANHLVSLSNIVLKKEGQPRIDLQQYVRSDHQGNFSFQRVPPSSYALQAVHSIFKSDELKSTESLPLELAAGERMTCVLGVNGASVRGKVHVGNETKPDNFAYRWSLNYLVAIDELAQTPIPNFNSAATWSTSEGAVHLKNFRHWQFKLDDDGSYSIHGVPPGKYRMYFNLFDQPQDGCLAAPIAIKAIDVLVPQLQEPIELPIVEMEANSLLKVGEVVPDFEYLQLDGTNASLQDLSGQIVLIQLWATWCGPCVAEFPEVREFVQSEAGRRCVVLGLNVDGQEQEIAGFLGHHKADWPQGRLQSGLDSPVLRKLSVSSIPMHFVINVDGRLVFSGRSLEEATVAVRLLLNSGDPSK